MTTPTPRYIIIGGVAGGATAAARIRRLTEKAEIILIEKGAYISYANCGLPYYIGGVIADRDRLFVQTPESFGRRFNIDVRTLSEVIAIDPSSRQVTVRTADGSRYVEPYDKLLLYPGASRRVHRTRDGRKPHARRSPGGGGRDGQPGDGAHRLFDGVARPRTSAAAWRATLSGAGCRRLLAPRRLAHRTLQVGRQPPGRHGAAQHRRESRDPTGPGCRHTPGRDAWHLGR